MTEAMIARSEPPTLAEVRTRRDEILRIASAYHAGNVRVFGSVAREQAGVESDIDFLVDLPGEYRGFDYFGLLDELREALEILLDRRVDVVNLRWVTPQTEQAAEQIQREAVAL